MPQTYSTTDAKTIAAHCESCLSLTEIALDPEYGYQHVPLCSLDAVWSIGVRYGGVQNVLRRYTEHCEIDEKGESAHTTSDLIAVIESVGAEVFAASVVQNRQRTSSRGGILKAEAVLHWARVLQDHGVETLEDVPAHGENKRMEADLYTIPGQSSGISLRYFYMLCGDETLIKPDRMTGRFLQAALGRTVTLEEMQDLYVAACRELNTLYPTLTPRRLDNTVWRYQRQQELPDAEDDVVIKYGYATP